MRLLVTGGAGFIGSNFIRYWLAAYPEDEVVNFDKLTYAGNVENLRDVESNPKYRFVKGDIADAAAVEGAMKDMDTVVNFAAESHVDRSILDPDEFIHTNVFGTKVLLDVALKNTVKRFHHISTDEVYGSLELASTHKFTEDSPYSPSSPYAASKAASDHLVRAYHATYGLPITITNCSNNYGSYQFPEKFIALAITNILESKKIPVYTPGNQVRDWLHVEDHCRALDLVLRQGKVGETYCVGGMTTEVSNIDVAKLIAKLLHKGMDVIELIKDRPGHDVKYAVDWAKIKKALGWMPRVDFEEGLKKTIGWYQENEVWWKKLKQTSSAYYLRQYGKP